jgi:hypothetical protein
VRNSAGPRKSSTSSSCLWPWKISSKPLRQRAADDEKDLAAARTRGDKHRTNRGTLRPSAARRCEITPEDIQPLLSPAHACDRRADLAAARRGSGAVPGDRDGPFQICLPCLRRGGGAGARTADQGGLPTKAMVPYASRLDKLMPWPWGGRALSKPPSSVTRSQVVKARGQKNAYSCGRSSA